jgi:hypothetical protein
MNADEDKAAMAELARIWHQSATAEQTPQRLEALAVACDAYEREHFPIPAPTEEQAAAYRAHEESRCGGGCEFCR